MIAQIIYSIHQMKCFSTILGIFWKIDFLKEIPQPRTLQNWWKFSTILNCAKKIVSGKIIYSIHQMKCFLHNFRQFLENCFLKEIRQPRTLQN